MNKLEAVIVGDVKDVEKFFAKVFKKAPSETAAALAIVNEIAPEVEIVFDLVDPEFAAVANPIITVVQADLGTVENLLKNGSTASVPAFLQSVKSNLSSLLTAGHITNPANVSRATGIFNAVVTAIDGLIARFTPAPAEPETAAAAA